MSCDASAYTDIATAVQEQGAKNKQAIWVGIPQFLFDAPEPVLIGHYVTDTISKLQAAGFTGDNIFLAAHSLGGVMAQQYAAKNSDIKGLVLMGSVILRNNHKLTDEGSTHFNYTVPTLTISGVKDGLLRISRAAEGYYHQVENVDPDQAGLFPIAALEGISHASFMSTPIPSNVRKNDLKMDMSLDDAHTLVAQQFPDFLKNVINGKKVSTSKSTLKVLQPLLNAMEMEGYYGMKPPCYDSAEIDEVSPLCLKDSPWVQANAHKIMAGSISSKVTIQDNNNFHRVETTNPIHLPHVNDTCDGTKKCTVDVTSISENNYNFLNKFDSGFYPISASEIKTKLMSRQSLQLASGVQDPDFSADDEDGNRCADINDASIQWALDNASKSALNNYNNYGVQMVTGDDLGPYNEGPLWIWTYMKYTQSSDKKTMTVQAPMMRTPDNYFIKSAAGFHYCKILSPFKVTEWIYTDGLKQFDGINDTNETLTELELFLQ